MAGCPGARRSTELRVAIRPRCSSRRRIWRSEPTALASSGPDISPARSASRTARCLTPSRSPPLSAASPAGRISARSSRLDRTARPPAPVPVPGGSTSCRPRAGVEQYSRPTQRPSLTSSGGAPASSASIGSASRSGGSSEASASSTTTPSRRLGPKGTRTTLPTSTPSIASGRR